MSGPCPDRGLGGQVKPLFLGLGSGLAPRLGRAEDAGLEQLLEGAESLGLGLALEARSFGWGHPEGDPHGATRTAIVPGHGLHPVSH